MSPVAVFLLMVLMACSWPVSRLLVRPSFRQVAPRYWWALVIGGLTAVAVLLILAVYRPLWLLAVTAAIVLVFGASAWRSRLGFGRSRGLPRGSLSPWKSVEAIFDRDFYRLQATQHGPIFKMAQFHRGVVCVVGLERGHRILREHRKCLGPSVQPFNREIDGGFLRYMDDSTHGRYAGMFRLALSSAVVSASVPSAGAAAGKELEEMAVASAQGRSISPERYLKRFVSRSFLSVLFGVLPGSDSFDRFEQIYPPLCEQPLGSPLGREALESLNALRQWVKLEADSMRDHDGSPIASSALGALVRSDEAMPDATAIDNLVFIYKISTDNVVALLRWLVKILGDHPGWAERLRDGRDTDGDVSSRIVQETLRLAQSEYLYRDIVEDFEVEGLRFPSSWLLRVCVRESHADRDMFHDPDTFNPDRFLDHRFDSGQYSPFGYGPHACNGVHLTMMIARTWIESLCEGYEWSIVQDGPVTRGFRHWSHWRPNHSLAIAIRPRSNSELVSSLREIQA